MFGELIALIVSAVLLGVLIGIVIMMLNSDEELHGPVVGMSICFAILTGLDVAALAVDMYRELKMPRVETTVKPHVDSTTTITSNPSDTTTKYIYDFNPERKRDAMDQE